MSAANAVRRCPHALFVRPRKDRYKEISLQIMDIFRESSTVIEPLSLDEAFIDISENHDCLDEAVKTAEAIRARIFNKIGLTCSAGVSHNKFLAKVASDINKPNGLTIISQEEADAFLAALPIGRFFGVGKVTEKKMHSLGIRKGEDLFRFSKDELHRFFGKAGIFFYDIVRGIDNRPVRVNRGRKSIGTETTFHEDITDLQKIMEILTSLSEKVEHGLKRKECGGSTVTLKVRYHDFTTVTRSHTQPSPLFSAAEIMRLIPNLLQTTDAGKTRVRLLGITVSNLCGMDQKQSLQLHLPFV